MQERNNSEKPWPYMYRPASPGMFGLPSIPLGIDRAISQSAARRMLSLYFPSRMVLPSISSARPPIAVMVMGYWSPRDAQWPSLDWFLASHSSPLSIDLRYSAGTSSERPVFAPNRISATPNNRPPGSKV